MPQSRVVTSCAALALAMVFSVQQGEHGPLVVYKLQVPKASEDATASAPTPLLPPAGPGKVKRLPVALTPPTAPEAAAVEATPGAVSKSSRLSPLKPSVLGTVVMPRSQPTQRTSAQPIPLLPLALQNGEAAPSYQVISDAPMSEQMVNRDTGQSLTLDEVTGAVEWRRNTVERLRATPLVPRF